MVKILTQVFMLIHACEMHSIPSELFPNKEFLQVLYSSGGTWLGKRKMFLKEIWHDFAGISLGRKRGEIENLNSLISRVSGFYVCWIKHDLLEVLVLWHQLFCQRYSCISNCCNMVSISRFLNRIIGSKRKIRSLNPKLNETVERSTKNWKQTSKLSVFINKTMYNF